MIGVELWQLNRRFYTSTNYGKTQVIYCRAHSKTPTTYHRLGEGSCHSEGSPVQKPRIPCQTGGQKIAGMYSIAVDCIFDVVSMELKGKQEIAQFRCSISCYGTILFL